MLMLLGTYMDTVNLKNIFFNYFLEYCPFLVYFTVIFDFHAISFFNSLLNILRHFDFHAISFFNSVLNVLGPT